MIRKCVTFSKLVGPSHVKPVFGGRRFIAIPNISNRIYCSKPKALTPSIDMESTASQNTESTADNTSKESQNPEGEQKTKYSFASWNAPEKTPDSYVTGLKINNSFFPQNFTNKLVLPLHC